MVVFKLHKWAGILLGFWLINLTVTGFFLNHEKNNHDLDFLWDVELDIDLFNDYAVKEHGNREITGYKYYQEEDWYLISSMRGVYINRFGYFERVYRGRVFKIEPMRDEDFNESFENFYLATDQGILKMDWNGNYEVIGLKNLVVTDIVVYGSKIYGVVNKKDVYLIEIEDNLKISKINIPENVQLLDNVRLGRFVRDFHYGRGLFENPYSMIINDVSTIYWFWLAVSGYLIFILYFFQKKKIFQGGKRIRKLIKLHGNVISLLILPVILLLSITGLLIDHPKFFSFITSKSVSVSYLPPIYKKPQSDIWGIDFDGEFLRIGTRYGVYKIVKDNLYLESEGFAYKMIRVGRDLYISGMGSPNRKFSEGVYINFVPSVHMPVDYILNEGKITPVSRKSINFEPACFPLYTFFLTLHDGSFFHRYFIFLNDISAIGVILITFTGVIRFLRRKRIF
ncbi:PepSY domain-containing protein [Persephonella sp.]